MYKSYTEHNSYPSAPKTIGRALIWHGSSRGVTVWSIPAKKPPLQRTLSDCTLSPPQRPLRESSMVIPYLNHGNGHFFHGKTTEKPRNFDSKGGTPCRRGQNLKISRKDLFRCRMARWSRKSTSQTLISNQRRAMDRQSSPSIVGHSKSEL